LDSFKLFLLNKTNITKKAATNASLPLEAVNTYFGFRIIRC